MRLEKTLIVHDPESVSIRCASTMKNRNPRSTSVLLGPLLPSCPLYIVSNKSKRCHWLTRPKKGLTHVYLRLPRGSALPRMFRLKLRGMSWPWFHPPPSITITEVSYRSFAAYHRYEGFKLDDPSLWRLDDPPSHDQHSTEGFKGPRCLSLPTICFVHS